MAQVNPLTREVLVKLVYYGPGLCGKTTSLQCIHASSPPETRGQIVSLATPVDRTLYFDFLPLRAQSVRGHHLRLQLFTVPGQVYFNATRKLVLTGADGVIFVADSQRDRLDANLESLENLAANLEDHQRSLANIPMVMQYNKRDLPTALEVSELDAALNALGVPVVCTNASKGEGVLEALDTLVRLVLEDLERRNVLGSIRPPQPEAPKFQRAEPGFAQQVELASQELRIPDEPPTRTDEHTPMVAPASVPPAPATPTSRPPAPAKVASLPPAPATATALPPAPVRPASVPPTLLSMTPHEELTSEHDVLRPTFAPPGVPAPARLAGAAFASLFPEDSEEATSIEAALAELQYARAVETAGALARRILRQVGSEADVPDAALHPSLVLPLLGFDGPRWLSFERLVRRAETGGPIDERDALVAYATVVEIRLRADRAL